MKLMFASDIHGSLYYCNKMIEAYNKEKPSKLILLGDLLYHGPRNDLPKDYNPKGVIGCLNNLKKDIFCVRGNCEAEVDQMVLEFPILADYMPLFLDGYVVFVTHGHLFNRDNLPLLNSGDIIMNGHTHIPMIEKNNDYIYLNTGSISLPKENNKHTYIIYEEGCFNIKELNDNMILQSIDLTV